MRAARQVSSVIRTPAGELRAEVPVETILRGPGDGWRFTGAAGREHWADDLVYVPGPSAGGSEDYAVSRWECRWCGEQVTPSVRRYVPVTVPAGPAAWTLDGQPVSSRLGEELTAAYLSGRPAREKPRDAVPSPPRVIRERR